MCDRTDGCNCIHVCLPGSGARTGECWGKEEVATSPKGVGCANSTNYYPETRSPPNRNGGGPFGCPSCKHLRTLAVTQSCPTTGTGVQEGASGDGRVHCQEYKVVDGNFHTACKYNGKSCIPDPTCMVECKPEWFFGPRRIGGNECDEETAEYGDCEEAVVAAAAKERAVAVKGFKEGNWNWVPPGCSYSHDSKMALWNNDENGQNNGNYQKVCERFGPDDLSQEDESRETAPPSEDHEPAPFSGLKPASPLFALDGKLKGTFTRMDDWGDLYSDQKEAGPALKLTISPNTDGRTFSLRGDCAKRRGGEPGTACCVTADRLEWPKMLSCVDDMSTQAWQAVPAGEGAVNLMLRGEQRCLRRIKSIGGDEMRLVVGTSIDSVGAGNEPCIGFKLAKDDDVAAWYMQLGEASPGTGVAREAQADGDTSDDGEDVAAFETPVTRKVISSFTGF